MKKDNRHEAKLVEFYNKVKSALNHPKVVCIWEHETPEDFRCCETVDYSPENKDYFLVTDVMDPDIHHDDLALFGCYIISMGGMEKSPS